METLNLFNVSDLYKSQEKLSHDLENLMNLLDFCGDKKDDDEIEVQKEVTSILSPAEESYLESIIENKVDAIINASKHNNRLKNSLYKLVDAFKVFDSQFIYSSPAPTNIDNNHVSIQAQTPPQSPVLTESEVQTDINDSIGEVIVLETINNEHKTPVRIIGANEGSPEENLPNDESLDDLQHIEKIRNTFKKLVKDQQKREKKNSVKVSEESKENNHDSEDIIITEKKKDLSLRHSTSNLSEAIKNSQIKVSKDTEVEVNLEKEKDKDNNILLNANSNNNSDNNDINTNTNNNNNQEKINNNNKNESNSSNNDSNNNDIKDNNNNKNQNIVTSTTSTVTTVNNEDNAVEKSNTKEHSTVIKPKPINVKNRKNYKRKHRNQSKESFTNPMLLSSSGSLLNPTPSPSQGIYLGKSNTQQSVLATRIQSIFSKQSTSTPSPTTKDAECQTESYKVVIRGEDYNIPPGYLGHYAVVPLWTIWVIGYYYKKKTKPKSMWKFLALKTPGLLAKSRAQNRNIKRVERITS